MLLPSGWDVLCPVSVQPKAEQRPDDFPADGQYASANQPEAVQVDGGDEDARDDSERANGDIAEQQHAKFQKAGHQFHRHRPAFLDSDIVCIIDQPPRTAVGESVLALCPHGV